VSQFVEKPFRYFDRIHMQTVQPTFTALTRSVPSLDELRAGTQPDPSGGFLVTPTLHPGVAEQPAGSNPFLGRLFVLIDGGTFSTAADASALIRHLTRATFIGEETGGAFEGNTSGFSPPVTLPNSRLRVRIQMYQYWNAVSGGERGRGTMPNETVERRTANILAGRDAALARALELARAGQPR